MLIFKKAKSSVFDILSMAPTSMGKIIESSNISKNYEKVQPISYTPLDLGVQDQQIAKEKDLGDNILHAKYFGIAAHFCLEMMDEFTLDSLAHCLNLAKTRYSNYLNESDFEDIANRITMMLRDDKFKDFIEGSDFITEQSLIYQGEIKIIDLLLKKDDKYYIFDYKTTKEKLASHKQQVTYYKKAISEIFNTPEVYSYLIYLQEDKVSLDEV